MCNCGCGNWGYNRIPIGDLPTPQKGVILREGPGITIDDNSDANNYDFTISREEIVTLTTALTLIAKILGVTQTQPILKGKVVDTVELDWVYNKVITSQVLSNSGGLAVPTLTSADRSYDYTVQNIINNLSFTITGQDGIAPAADTKSISFGNEMILGKGVSKIGAATSGIEAFIDSLATHVIKTSRVHSFNAVGVTNEKDFVAYPAAYGLATFTKLTFQGGFVRLKNVAGVLKSTLAPGDIETAINFTNPAGYVEAYYIYESLVDDQADPVNPFTIS